MPLSPPLHFEALPPLTRKALGDISQIPIIKQFYLAGGTALAIYFGHRKSADLDFFTEGEVEAAALLNHLAGEGKKFELEKQSADTLLGIAGGIKVGFFHYPYPLLASVTETEGIRLASVVDIACMKVNAISSRGTKRDFIDVYWVLQSGILSLNELLPLFQKKYAALNYNLVHIKKSLTYFEEAEEEPLPKMLVPLEWPEVKRFFQKELRTIA